MTYCQEGRKVAAKAILFKYAADAASTCSKLMRSIVIASESQIGFELDDAWAVNIDVVDVAMDCVVAAVPQISPTLTLGSDRAHSLRGS